MKRALAAWLALVFIATASFAAVDGARLKAGVFSPPAPAPDFSLRGSDGAELNLARFRGKVVALFFGFTHCPEVCPVTLATLAHVRKQLGANGNAMQVVYVTVDPERDSVPRLKAHLANFDPAFVGGTGKPEVLEAVRKHYGVVANKVKTARGDDAVDHSSSVFLIDREGKLRAMMPYGHSAADYVHDVQALLKQ